MTKTKDNTSATIASAAHAAENAAAAALSAAEASKTASDNAQIAAKAAAESATAIAVVATDTSWMKKSLEGIEITLNDMNKAFITAAQHAELLKIVDGHSIDIESLKTEKTRTVVLLIVGSSILTLLTSLLVYHLFQR